MAPHYSTYQSGVSLGSGQTLSFKKGRGYFARGQVTDPFATYSEPAIAAKVKQIVGRLPAPQTDAQIQTSAQGMLDPVVKQITDAINARAKAGGSAVGGYTDQLAKNLMGASGHVDAAYRPAEQSVAASNAALADRLSGAGNATGDALAARLASIGEPGATGAATAAVRQAGTGAGNALYATGNASLDQLLGNHATASDYAGKLPDLARLSGVQQLGAVQGRAQQDIRDQTGQVTAQLPSIVQNLRSQSDTRATNRASAASDIWQYLTGRNTDIGKFKQAEADAGFNATTKAAATVKAATIKANEQAAKDAKPNATLSGKVGYVVDSNGQWIPSGNGKPQVLPGFKLQNGQVVKITAAGGGKGGAKVPTAGQITTMVKQWHDGTTTKTQVKQPNLDANNNPVYRTKTTKTGQVPFSTAYKRLKTLLTSGGMDAAAADKQARSYLQGYYKRGETDRGWLTNEEQATLAQAKVIPRAYTNSGVGYLYPDQARALKAAGLMPPGHWIQGKTDRQDLGPVYIIEP